MAIEIIDPDAGQETRQEMQRLVLTLAALLDAPPSDALLTALREAISRRAAPTPLQAAARLRRKFGVSLTDTARKPLPRDAFDAMWDDD